MSSVLLLVRGGDPDTGRQCHRLLARPASRDPNKMVAVSTSLHLAVRALIRGSIESAGHGSVMDYDVVRAIGNALADAGGTEYRFYAGAELFNEDLSAVEKLTRKRRGEPAQTLIYGIKVDDEKPENDDAATDGGSVEEFGAREEDRKEDDRSSTSAEGQDEEHEDDDDGDDPNDHPDDRVPDHVPYAGTRQGLIGYGIAPTSRVMCFICKSRIEQGALRFEYQIRPGSAMFLRKHCHAECVKHLPRESRRLDYNTMQFFAADLDLPEELVAQFDHLVNVLNPDSGTASGSGGAGAGHGAAGGHAANVGKGRGGGGRGRDAGERGHGRGRRGRGSRGSGSGG